MGPTFFGKFFCQKHWKNSAVAKKIKKIAFFKNRQKKFLPGLNILIILIDKGSFRDMIFFIESQF